MWKHLKYLLISFIIILIQTQLIPLISLKGINPDLLTIWIVYIALQKGQMQSTIWGFIIGLLFDFIVGNFIGLSALSKTITGFFAGYFYSENKAQMILGSYRFIIIVLITSFIHNSVYFVVFTFGTEISIIKAIFQIGLATTFYTAAIALLPMFFFYRKSLF